MWRKYQYYTLAAAAAATGVLWNPPKDVDNKQDCRRPGKRVVLKDRKNVIARADKLVRIFREKNAVPGISVGVSVNGRIVWQQGYGYSDVENLVPCTAYTVMRIASISKPLTMTIVAKLMESGKLDLDAPIQSYVPEFPEKEVDGEKVTISTRHLVSHLSGIRHYEKSNEVVDPELLCKKCRGNMRDNSDYNKLEFYSNRQYETIAEALNMFKDDPLLAKPGTSFIYTTHGWTLISAVVERAGKEQFTRQFLKLFADLGMRNTHLDENEKLLPDRTRYYFRIGGSTSQLCNSPGVNNSYKWAGGGVVSTVGDLLLFGNEMLRSFSSTGYLRQDTVESMWTPAMITKNTPGSKTDNTSISIDDKSGDSKVDKASDSTSSKTKKNTGGGGTVDANRSNVGNSAGDKKGNNTGVSTVARAGLSGSSIPCNYGMGWFVDAKREGGGKLEAFLPPRVFTVSHSGGAIGASSILLLRPRKCPYASAQNPAGVAVVVLTNLQNCLGLRFLAVSLAELFDDAARGDQ